MSTKEKDAAATPVAVPAAGGARKQLAAWVGEKFKKSQESVKQTSDIGEITSVLNDYNLVFTGAIGALKAIGTDESVLQPLSMALELNEADLTAAEKRFALEQELGQ